MGDLHPCVRELRFYRRKRGKHVWVSVEKLSALRAQFKQKESLRFKKHKVALAAYFKNRYATNPEFRKRRLASKKRSYESDRETYKIKSLATYHKNKDRYRPARRAYRNRRNQEGKFRILGSLSQRLRCLLKYPKNKQRTLDLVGCPKVKFLRHVENQFLPGMTWANYGEWHLDHIRPCISFDFYDPVQVKQCFHFSNLRPLWAVDNIRKGGRRDKDAELKAELLFLA